MLRTLDEMDAKGLSSAELEESPWSDDYWPMYKGVLGNRYAEAQFPASKDWKENKDYVELNAADSSSVDTLSPAEKYDLLVGDAEGTLTAQNWSEGEK